MRVSALFRYPVKSMQGERLESAVVGTHGIVGDRQWGLLDLDTGLMLTARREPALLMASARVVDPPDVHDVELEPEVVITLPDGTAANDDATLSAWLGRRVELRRADPETDATYEIALAIEDEDMGGEPTPCDRAFVSDAELAEQPKRGLDEARGSNDPLWSPTRWVQWTGPRGSFHDSTKAQVSLVTDGSMRSWEWRRFRANVVVSGPDGAEDGFVGQHVHIGSAGFDVRKQIDRCVMTTRAQPANDQGKAIERDLSVLKTINAERATFLAVGMMVDRSGTITVGDDVLVEPAASAPGIATE